MPMVMVEIAPPDPPAALAQALLDACSAAVRAGRCVLDDPASKAESVAVAIVRWDDAGDRHAHVEVGMRNTGEPMWSTRNLDFGDADPPIERWRTVGLTIATLAGEMVARVEQPKASTEPQPAAGHVEGASSNGDHPDEAPTGVGGRPGSQKPSSRETRWIGGTLGVGPGLDDGSLRWGGWADIGWRPLPLPLFLRLSLGVAVRPRDVHGLSVQWETATLGLGGIVGNGPVTLEPRLAASLDAVHAAVADSTSQREDSGTRVGFGVHAGAEALFHFDRSAFVASLDAWHVGARTDILVENARTGVSAADGWAVGLGFRFFLQ
jgi:hypothetical protein